METRKIKQTPRRHVSTPVAVYRKGSGETVVAERPSFNPHHARTVCSAIGKQRKS